MTKKSQVHSVTMSEMID